MIDLEDSTVAQTEELCIEAVRQDVRAMQYVTHQTEAICMEAIRQNVYALQYVHNQTEAICICAVKQYGYAIQFVKKQTEAICLCAVKENGHALKYVSNQTEAICICAVKENGLALEHVHHQTDAMHILVLNQYKERLRTMPMFEILWFSGMFHNIKNPSPYTINLALQLFPIQYNIIMKSHNTQTMMDNYKTQHKLINSELILYTNDFLYRPNNIAYLLRIHYNSTKTSFLIY